MKRIPLIFILACLVGYVSAQSNPKPLNLIVVIDGEISRDIINGKFIVKDGDSKPIDEMQFRAWVGNLEMTKQDYKKLFTIKPQDTLYFTFQYNSYELHDDYVYEGKIPKGMMNSHYLILNIYNKKNKDSSERYVFPANKEYVFQVESPGKYTHLKMAIMK